MKRERVLWVASRAVGHCRALGMEAHPALCCCLSEANISIDGYVIGYDSTEEDLEALRLIVMEAGYVAHWDG